MDFTIHLGTVIVSWGESLDECEHFKADELSRSKGKFVFMLMSRAYNYIYDYRDAIELGLNCMRKHGLKFANQNDERLVKSLKEELKEATDDCFYCFPLKK